MEELFRDTKPAARIERIADCTERLIASVHYEGGTESYRGWTLKAEAVVREVSRTDGTGHGAPEDKRFGVCLFFMHEQDEDRTEPLCCWLDFDECRGLLGAIQEIDGRVGDLTNETFEEAHFRFRTVGGFELRAWIRPRPQSRGMSVVVDGRQEIPFTWEMLGRLRTLMQQSVSALRQKEARREPMACV